MIVETIIALYVIIGSCIGLAMIRETWDDAFPPEIQGAIVVALFWLPAFLLAMALSSRQPTK